MNYSVILFSTAKAGASTRVRNTSFLNKSLICTLTVVSVMPSEFPITLLLLSRVIWLRISTSLLVGAFQIEKLNCLTGAEAANDEETAIEKLTRCTRR